MMARVLQLRADQFVTKQNGGSVRSRAALWRLDRDLVSTEEPAAGGVPNLRDGHLGFWGLEPTAVAARAGGVRGRRLARSIKAGH